MITEDDLINCSSLELSEKLFAQANPGFTLINGFENGPCDLLVRDLNGDRDFCASWRSNYNHLQNREHISDLPADYYEDYSTFQYGYYNQSSLDKELWDNLGTGVHSEVVKNASELYSVLVDTGNVEDAENWEECFRNLWALPEDFSLETFRVFCMGDPKKRYTASQRQQNHFVLGHHNSQALIIPYLGPYSSQSTGKNRLVNWNRISNILRFIGLLVVQYNDGAVDIARERGLELFYRIARNSFSELDIDSFKFPKIEMEKNGIGGPNSEVIKRYALITEDMYNRIAVVCENHAETVEMYRAVFPDLNEWTHREVLRVVSERRLAFRSLIKGIFMEKEGNPDEIIDWQREKKPFREMAKGLTKASRVSYLLDRAMMNFYAVRLKEDVPEFVVRVLADKGYEEHNEVLPNTARIIQDNIRYFAPKGLAKLFQSFLVFFFQDKCLKKFVDYVADVTDDILGLSKATSSFDNIWHFYFTGSGCRRWANFHVRRCVGKAYNLLSNVSHKFAMLYLKPTDFLDIYNIIIQVCKKRLNFWVKRYESHATKVGESSSKKEKARAILNQNRVLILKRTRFKVYRDNIVEAFVEKEELKQVLYKIIDGYTRKRQHAEITRNLDPEIVMKRFDDLENPLVPFSEVWKDVKRILSEVVKDIRDEVVSFLIDQEDGDLQDLVETPDKAIESDFVNKMSETSIPVVVAAPATLSLFDDLDVTEFILKKDKKKINPDKINLLAHYGSDFKSYEDAVEYAKEALGENVDPTAWIGPVPAGTYNMASIVAWYKNKSAKQALIAASSEDKEEISEL